MLLPSLLPPLLPPLLPMLLLPWLLPPPLLPLLQANITSEKADRTDSECEASAVPAQ
jgi:hypothetical protein